MNFSYVSLWNKGHVRLAYQPPASSTFLSEQISTSHQPTAKRAG
jgi:hypothetical protein